MSYALLKSILLQAGRSRKLLNRFSSDPANFHAKSRGKRKSLTFYLRPRRCAFGAVLELLSPGALENRLNTGVDVFVPLDSAAAALLFLILVIELQYELHTRMTDLYLF